MNVQNNLHGLQQLFSGQEVTQPAHKTGGPQAAGGKAEADQAILSSAASAASAVAADADVRTEKVAAIQQALADGTYNVPAFDVAGKMIYHMLGK